jgi:hypothetical protein
MTTGALIFAFNNQQIDYVALARWTAGNIRRHLRIPVCLITDTQQQDLSGFDKTICVGPTDLDMANTRYFSDYGTTVTWHNTNRMDAYKLSPWDQTLVLDADYVVASNYLSTVLTSDQDFMCYRWATDVTGLQTFEDLNYFGNYRMPMWWATVMMFRRSNSAELLFDTMQMIRDNWTHYRNLYKNSVSTYRNDHALSIALNTLNGHTLQVNGIPGTLASLTPEHQLTQIDTDSYRVDFLTPDNTPRWITLKQDFHAMGKQQLGAIVANSR